MRPSEDFGYVVPKSVKLDPGAEGRIVAIQALAGWERKPKGTGAESGSNLVKRLAVARPSHIAGFHPRPAPSRPPAEGSEFPLHTLPPPPKCHTSMSEWVACL